MAVSGLVALPATKPANTEIVQDTATKPEPPVTGTMFVHRPGSAGSCQMRRVTDAKDNVIVDASCRDIYPALMDVSAWQEKSDGTVVLSDANESTVIMLGLADGHAYEALYPPTAMLVLVADEGARNN